MMSETSNLTLILGPMFSGKTTELLRILSIYSKINIKCLFINSIKDNRDNNESFSTHNSMLKTSEDFDFIKVNYLNDIFLNKNIKAYEVFGIDEAQFMEDLDSTVLRLYNNYNKKIIVCSLNGDYKRRPYEKVNNLIPYCDNIIKLNSYCYYCSLENKIIKAPYTKLILDYDKYNNDKKLILIGGSEKYKPVCKNHY